MFTLETRRYLANQINEVKEFDVEDFTLEVFEKNENENERMLNAVLIAKRFGTQGEYSEGLTLMLGYVMLEFPPEDYFEFQSKMFRLYYKLYGKLLNGGK